MNTQPETKAQWVDHYSHPHKFAELFKDYGDLRAAPSLSNTQRIQLNVVEEMIDGKLH